MATISITLDTQNIDTRLSSLKTAASGVDKALLSIKDAAKLLLPQFRQLALYTRVLATSNASLIKSANAVSAATAKVTRSTSATTKATYDAAAAANRKIITDKNRIAADKKIEAQLHRVTKAANEAAISADRLAKQRAKVATATDKVSKSSKKLLPRVLKITAAYMAMRTALRAAVSTFQGFLSFQDSMIRVGAITGATAEEFDQLTAAANRMGETTIWTADEAAKALRTLAQAGLGVSESMSALPGVLDLAMIGSLDLEKATNIAIGTTNAFRLGLEQIGHVNDVLATASMSALTNVRELGVAMTYTAKAADIQGFSLEETTAMLEVLAGGNLKAGRAGRYLATMMRKTGSAAKKLGLDAGAGLLEVLEKIKTSSLSASEMSALFGARAYQAAVILAQGLPAYEAYLQKLKDVDGATASLVDRIKKSLLNKLKLLKSALTGVAFESFGEGAGSLSEKIARLTEDISQNKDEIVSFLTSSGKGIVEFMALVDKALGATGSFVRSVYQGYMDMPDIVKGMGLVGAVMFGAKGALLFALIANTNNKIDTFLEKMKLVASGHLSVAAAAELSDIEIRKMFKAMEKSKLENITKLYDELVLAINNSNTSYSRLEERYGGLIVQEGAFQTILEEGLDTYRETNKEWHIAGVDLSFLQDAVRDTTIKYEEMTTAQKTLNKALADAKFEKSLIGLDKHDIAIAKLQRSYKSFKVVNEDAAKAWLAYRLAVLKANEENDAAKKKLSGVTAELSELRKELKEEQFGAATDALDSYEKKLVTLDHELENHIEKIKEKTDRTEEEKLKLIDLEEQIYAVKRARVISADNLAREKREAEGVNSELDRMSKELDKTGKKNKETTDLMADAWASFDSSLEGVLSGTFSGEFESIGGMFKDLLKSMYSNFINWVAKVAAQQIVFNISGEQAGSNTLGNIFSGLFGGGSGDGGFNPTTGILGGIVTKGKDLWSGYQSGGLSGAWDTATGWFGGGASSGASYLSGLGSAGYGATAAYGAQGVFDAGRYSGTFLQGSVGNGSMWASSASTSSSALSTAAEIMPFVAAAYSYYSLATADEKTPQNVGGAMSATVGASATLAGAGPVGWVAAIPSLVLTAVQMIGDNQHKPSREYFDPYYSRELGDDKYFVAGRKVESQVDQSITDNSWATASSLFVDTPRNWNVVYDKKANAFYNIDSSDLYDPKTKGSLFPEYYASSLVDQNAAAIAAGYGDQNLTYDSIFSLIANSKVSDYDQTDIPIELQKQLEEWQQPASMKDLVDAGVITEEEFLSRVNSAIESGVAEKLQYYEFKDELAVAQYGKAQKYPMMLKSLQSAFPVEDILEGMLDEAKASAGALKSNYAESLGGLFDEAVEGAIDGLDMTAIQSTLGEGYNETVNELNTQLTEAMTPIQERFQILSDIATAVDPSETHLMTYKEQVDQITAAYDESEKKLVDLGATQAELTKLDELEAMAKNNLKEQTEKSIDVILHGATSIGPYEQAVNNLNSSFDAADKVLVALGATTDQIAEQDNNRKEAEQNLISEILNGPKAITAYDQALEDIKARYDDNDAALKLLNATTEQTAQNTKNYQDALAQLAAERTSSINLILSSVDGMSDINSQSKSLIDKYAGLDAQLTQLNATEEDHLKLEEAKIRDLAEVAVASEDFNAAIKSIEDTMIASGESIKDVAETLKDVVEISIEKLSTMDDLIRNTNGGMALPPEFKLPKKTYNSTQSSSGEIDWEAINKPFSFSEWFGQIFTYDSWSQANATMDILPSYAKAWAELGQRLKEAHESLQGVTQGVVSASKWEAMRAKLLSQLNANYKIAIDDLMNSLSQSTDFSAFTDPIQQVLDAFDAWIAAAKKLGGSSAQMEADLEKWKAERLDITMQDVDKLLIDPNLASYEQQIEQVRFQFEGLIEQAKLLGATEEQLQSIRDKEQEYMQGKIDDIIGQATAGERDPLEDQLAALHAQYDLWIEQAKILGATETELARIRAAESASIQAMKDDILDNLYNPEENDPLAQLKAQIDAITQKYESLIAKAQILGMTEEELAQIRAAKTEELGALLADVLDQAMPEKDLDTKQAKLDALHAQYDLLLEKAKLLGASEQDLIAIRNAAIAAERKLILDLIGDVTRNATTMKKALDPEPPESAPIPAYNTNNSRAAIGSDGGLATWQAFWDSWGKGVEPGTEKLKEAADKLKEAAEALLATATSDLISAVNGRISDLNKMRSDVEKLYGDQIAEQQKIVDQWESISENLKDIAVNLLTMGQTVEKSAVIGKNQFDAAIQALWAGDLSKAGDIGNIASGYADTLSLTSTSGADYRRSLALMAAQLNGAAGLGSGAVSEAQRQIDLLQLQLDSELAAIDAEIAYYENVLVLLGENVQSSKNLEEAFAAYFAAGGDANVGLYSDPFTMPSDDPVRWIDGPGGGSDPVRMVDGATVNELKDMRTEMVNIGAQQIAINKKLSKIFDKWDRDGMPAERVA